MDWQKGPQPELGAGASQSLADSALCEDSSRDWRYNQEEKRRLHQAEKLNYATTNFTIGHQGSKPTGTANCHVQANYAPYCR